MVFSLPIQEPNKADIRKIGITIQEINILLMSKCSVTIEPSVIINTECFEEYLKNRILPEQIVKTCLEHFKRFNFAQVDIYISVYKDCMVNNTPITVSVSYATIYNAIVALYERWFDMKPFSRRTVLHLKPSDTYPAILFQPHREVELSTITRHPKTGILIRNGDGENIVHCSNATLTEDEEKMIKSIDSTLESPRKIMYVQSIDGRCIIRRTVTYPMTVEAKLSYIFDRYEYGAVSRLKAVSLILPENIFMIDSRSYRLSSKNQYSGISTSSNRLAVGKAVFRWSNKLSVSNDSIFLADYYSDGDTDYLKKCVGGIFSHGGMTSHEAYACRYLDIVGIVYATDLLFDMETQNVYTTKGETICEGDRICIADSKWSIGGDIIANDNYRAL